MPSKAKAGESSLSWKIAVEKTLMSGDSYFHMEDSLGTAVLSGQLTFPRIILKVTKA